MGGAQRCQSIAQLETAMGFATLYPSYGPETNMDKIDFKKQLSKLYSAPKGSFATVDVPVMKFVKIDGKGDPNRDPAYKAPSSGCIP
jgi:hypothetical protein